MEEPTDEKIPLLVSPNVTPSGYRSILNEAGEAENRVGTESEIDDDEDDDDLNHKTTVAQTFIHLLKGYLGAGCLSLPWAVSQLGMFYGPLAIITVSYWSSYNCWTIVKLKRFIEQEPSYIDDKASQSEASSVTTNTNVTYPDVGNWAYGSRFQSFVAVCVCTQQLAVCTVFISFVGENLQAVMQSMDISFMATHTGVMTLELPFLLMLSLFPNLKRLAPVMTVGTVLLLLSFFAIGVVIHELWDYRPSETPEIDLSTAPLAISAILYSYEGINLVLPVESAMLEPQQFRVPFVMAMCGVAFILSSFSAICVVTFGYVSSGSVTAFLLQAYPDDPSISWWIMLANSAVSLSVLLSYPLQLFPVLEIMAPSFSRFLASSDEDDADIDNDELSAFEPLPPLPEHDIPAVEEWGEHQYNVEVNLEGDEDDGTKDPDSTASVAHSAITSLQSMLPEMTMPGDSPLLRILLVFMTYIIAVIVPNVQSLISLAGALAGSSTALLIPPMLELAWIAHLEADRAEDEEGRDESRWTIMAPGTEHFGWGKWWFEKLKCYVLLLMGFLFFVIGTYASVADIVRTYAQPDELSPSTL